MGSSDYIILASGLLILYSFNMLSILLMEMIQPAIYISIYRQNLSNACMIDRTPTPFPSDIFRSIKITLMSADFQVMEERIKMAQCI